MWIYIPSEFYPSAQESAESNLDLSWQSQLLEQSVMSKSKPLRAKSWQAAWKKKDWIKRLFGRILKPSMANLGVESWIASLADIPVSRLVLLEKSLEIKTQDTSGQKLKDSSQKSNHQFASSKMSEGIYDLDLKKSQMTYGNWVIKLRQACLQRQKLVLRIKGKGSSFWPTVIVSDHLCNPCETPERWKERSEQKKMEGINLHKPLRIVAQEVWPTVVSADAAMGEIISPSDTYIKTPSGQLRKINKNGTNGSLGLARTVRIWEEPSRESWPTITVTDASVMKARPPEKMIRKDGRKVLRSPSLAETILQPQDFPRSKEDLENKDQGLPYQTKKFWPTVRTSSANGASSKEVEAGNPKQRLEVMIANWPTVTVQDYKRRGPNSSQQGLHEESQKWPTPRAQEPGSTSANYGKGLKNTAENWATPTARDWKDNANADVPTNSLLGRQAPRTMKAGTESQMTLNPRFTEWLMGWPIGWTEFELAETEWFHWLQLMRGELLRMECISQKIN